MSGETAGADTKGPKGKPVTPDDPRRVIRLGQWVLAGFFVLFLGIAAVAPISAAAVAEGKVTVLGNLQTVQATYGGRVKRLLVRDGDRVVRDQVVLELEDDLAQAQLDVLISGWDALKAQEARLVAEQVGAGGPAFDPALASRIEREGSYTSMLNERRLFVQREQEAALEQAMYEAQMEQLRTSAEASRRQASASEHKIGLTSQELAGMRQLYQRGFAPKVRVNSLERSIADMQQERESYVQAAAEAGRSIGETRLALARAQTARLNAVSMELNSTQIKLAETAPRIQAAERRLELTRLRAPAAGQVVGQRVFTNGAVIGDGEKILDIVPANAPLVIEAKVSPRDVDEVRLGARSEVRFTSLPTRLNRSVPGRVETISADALHDQRTGESYYVARVHMNPQALREAGLRLTPGMPVQVFIRARSRTMLQYLVEPLSDEFARAFREN